MADSQRYITVHLVVGTPVPGLWCTVCALPSRVRFPLYRLSSRGVTLHCNILRCTEHEPSLSTDDEDD